MAHHHVNNLPGCCPEGFIKIIRMTLPATATIVRDNVYESLEDMLKRADTRCRRHILDVPSHVKHAKMCMERDST